MEHHSNISVTGEKWGDDSSQSCTSGHKFHTILFILCIFYFILFLLGLIPYLLWADSVNFNDGGYYFHFNQQLHYQVCYNFSVVSHWRPLPTCFSLTKVNEIFTMNCLITDDLGLVLIF